MNDVLSNYSACLVVVIESCGFCCNGTEAFIAWLLAVPVTRMTCLSNVRTLEDLSFLLTLHFIICLRLVIRTYTLPTPSQGGG